MSLAEHLHDHAAVNALWARIWQATPVLHEVNGSTYITCQKAMTCLKRTEILSIFEVISVQFKTLFHPKDTLL